jgi:hypothetical protein
MKKINLILALVITLSACERIVELEIPSSDPTIVVEGQITSQLEPWEIRITMSQPYFDQSNLSFVSNAEVSIVGTDGSDVNLIHSDSGYYKSEFSQQCLPGETYSLSVMYDGQEYSASEVAPMAFPIDTIASYYLPENNGFIEEGYYVFIQGKERPAKGDFYLFKAYRNDTLKDDFGSNLDSDEFGSVSFLNEDFDINNIASELSKGKTPRPFPFTVEPGDTVRVEQYAISEKYFNYIFDIEAQQGRSGTPFDPPPANPNNNISNGGLGYFSVVHKEEAQIVVDE